jgi:hypothetical protein
MDYALMKNIISKKFYYSYLLCVSYADNLKKNKLKLDYLKIEDKDFKDDYFKKLKKIIIKNKIIEISSF